MRIVRSASRAFLAVLFLATLPVAVVYALANGPTAGALALGSVPVLAGLGLAAFSRVKWLALGIVALDVAWIVVRAARPAAVGPVSCVELRCDGRGSWWQRVPDEHEAARAAVEVSKLLGTVQEPETSELFALFDAEYIKIPVTWRGLPNALLLRSTEARVESFRWQPAAPGKLPAVVFLHGYGGALTPYFRAIVQSAIGARFVVVAPALDASAQWWSSEGLAIVRRVLTTQLPDSVDRDRVYLLGLSNGAVGVADLLPKLRSLLRGAVLLSGLDDPQADLAGLRLLVFAGTRDPRFPLSTMREGTTKLRERGADVTLVELEATHGLMLTQKAAWTDRFIEWAR